AAPDRHTEGIVSRGLRPTGLACRRALDGGVKKTHILDGRVPHALLLEFFTREGVGTMITRTVEDD
ncbi:MAG: hypothetical protein ACKOVH_02960, partial [Actinomycetota bacterium]